MTTLAKLQAYARNRKALLPISLLLSTISSIVNLLPFIYVWLIVRDLINTGLNQSYDNIIHYAIMAFVFAVSGLIIYFLTLLLSHLGAFRVETELRRVAMNKIIKMPLGFFDKNTTGKIRKIIDENASTTHSFMAHQMPDIAGTIFTPILIIGATFFFDWKLGIACLFPVLIAIVILNMMMGKRGNRFMQKYLNSLEEMNTEAVEYVRGIPVVKVFQQTVFSFKSFYNSIKQYKDMVIKYTRLWEKPMSAYTTMIHSFAFFLVPVAILFIDSSPKTILINLLLYVLITPVFAQSILKSMHLNHAFSQAREAINRIEDLTIFHDFKETKDSGKTPNTFDIEFKDVEFAYPESNKNAVDKINFSIQQGKTTALVGPSGGGKTTIARLIPRFWDVKSGSIKIGGIDVKNIPTNKLMQNVAFVFQNTRLFKKTILDNVKYGCPQASIDDVNRALDLAQCRNIIDNLKDGINTMIGTEGTYLSGGEQQRIILARAILKDAPIIVLDEATAFADPENEYLIRKALQKLTQGKTVLMIAHRLSSIKDVDKIMVINKGKVHETGTHQTLLQTNGLYTKMWKEYEQSVKWTIGEEVQYA
ncbi:MAG: ABC transporter ATP-binding protein/permease [Bacteroidales bacterium]|nr:ABC transporter ATP-binding protein/permease [Bacteroidales bacterium]